jgi:hypothetical protein
MTPEERVALEEAALKWMADNNAGIKKALKQPQFSVFTQGQLHRAQDRAAVRARTGNLSGNAGNRMLTHAEEEELVQWIIAKNLKLDGADTKEVGNKVLVILKARQTVLRAVKQRRGQPLSNCAKKALKTRKVGYRFFGGLRERHGDRIRTGRSSNVDLKKCTRCLLPLSRGQVWGSLTASGLKAERKRRATLQFLKPFLKVWKGSKKLEQSIANAKKRKANP